MRRTGQCHCGAIRVAFETRHPLAPRACQCGFCHRHGARTVSDPEGGAVLDFTREPIRYRFALKAADYLLCAICGVYVGAVAEIGGSTRATLNLNAFDDPHAALDAQPVSYDGESAAAKTGRRLARWTPIRLTRR